MDHQSEHPLNRHAEKMLARLGDLDPATAEGRSRSSGGYMQDLGVGRRGDDPSPGVLMPVLRGQAHRSVGAPLATAVVGRRFWRLGCPDQTTRTSDRFFGPGEVGIGQLNLDSPAMSGEVDLSSLDFMPHFLKTQRLERELDSVGVGDLGATPYRGGLVLHHGQWAIVHTFDDVAAPGQPQALRTYVDRPMLARSALRGVVHAPVGIQSGLHLHGIRFLPHRFKPCSPRTVNGMNHQTDRNRFRNHLSCHVLSPLTDGGGDTSAPPPELAPDSLQDQDLSTRELASPSTRRLLPSR